LLSKSLCIRSFSKKNIGETKPNLEVPTFKIKLVKELKPNGVQQELIVSKNSV
jgi:hypothetical protein